MEWQEINTFVVSNEWQYSNRLSIRNFKVVYLSFPLLTRDSMGIIALANMPDNPLENSTEFFKPQRITSFLPSEIIQFPQPLKGWDYRLAVKKLPLPNQQTIDFTIQIFMPVIDLTPDQPTINPTIATTKNITSVGVGATAAVKLLPINAGNIRKHATFYNPGTTRNLYIDTDSNINIASAIAKVAPGKIYVSDVPGWQGEYWAILDGSGSTAVPIAVEEYV